MWNFELDKLQKRIDELRVIDWDYKIKVEKDNSDFFEVLWFKRVKDDTDMELRTCDDSWLQETETSSWEQED